MCAPLGANTPRNPELIYAILQKQSLLLPYAGHPRLGAPVAHPPQRPSGECEAVVATAARQLPALERARGVPSGAVG
eukprot:161404-Chlamydomonas_euryale.AAC.1